MEDSKEKPSLRKSVWPLVKPFVNGGHTSLLSQSIAYFVASSFYTRYPAAKLSNKLHLRKMLYFYQQTPYVMFQSGIYMATLFGSYEHLTRKVEAFNEGRALTLYQEVIRNDEVLALWKGTSSLAIPAAIASNTGMLVSYDRCRIYLKEKYGLKEGDARIGAGLFSGLCSGACYLPIYYAGRIIGHIQSKRVESRGSFLFYASKILKPGGGSNFYSQLANLAVSNSPGIMIMWVLLEAIRDAEESIGL